MPDDIDIDYWETSSGLPDDMTVTVDNPHFGYSSHIGDATVCMFFLEGRVTSSTDDNPEFSQWYTVGRRWEPGNNGAILVREDGRPAKINSQTNYAHLF